MKKSYLISFLFGILVGFLYLEYAKAKEDVKLYGSRDIQAELKIDIDRANIVLDTMDKKYINKNVPKPDVPKPDISCKCNGTGVITQPDGNKSQCQCFSKPEGCTCRPKLEPPQ